MCLALALCKVRTVNLSNFSSQYSKGMKTITNVFVFRLIGRV